jgi:hypothetical protein
MKPSGTILALVKPQFEAGKGKVGKKGVIRRSEDRLEVLRNHVAMVQDHGLFCVDLMLSPIEGAEGNIEYLSLLVVPGEAAMWRERLGLPGEGYPDEARWRSCLKAGARDLMSEVRFRKIGLYCNRNKPQVMALARSIYGRLEELGAEPMISREIEARVGIPGRVDSKAELCAQSQALVVLGGMGPCSGRPGKAILMISRFWV